MKTGLFRLWVAGASVFGVVLSGCGQRTAEMDVPPPVAMGAPYIGPAQASFGTVVTPVPVASEPAVVAAPVVEPVAVPVPVPVATNMVAAVPAAIPTAVMLSPAMQEVVKMQQAGVSEAVIMSYVTNSPSRFGLTSDQIIYLHDLGMSSDVTKTLIEHDAAVVSAKAQPAAAPIIVTPSMAAPSSLPLSYEQAQPVTTVAPTMVTSAVSQPQDNVDYFYSHLAPYGNWVQMEGYGLCWQPSAALTDSNWRPYADEGYWLWTDNGWYWYSYYTWGWAPFHYGRWSHHSRIGWFWVPDTHWGPSWVSWRESGDYCGWAPLPPEVVYVQGAGLRYHGGAFSVGFDFGLTDFYYTFIPVGHFGERHPSRYYLPPGRRAPLFRASIVINRFDLDHRHGLVHRGVEFDRVNHAAPGLVQRATFKEAALGAPAGPRPEHLEIRAEGVVVHRPVLPKDPPPRPVQAAQKAKEPSGVLLPGRSGRPAARPDGPERRPEATAAATATPSVRLPAVQNVPPVVSSGTTRTLPATRSSGPAPSGVQIPSTSSSTPDALTTRAMRPSTTPPAAAPPTRGAPGSSAAPQRPATSSAPINRAPAGPSPTVSTPAPVSPMSPPRSTIAPTISTPRPVTPVAPTISTPRAVAPIAPLSSSPVTRSPAGPSPSVSAPPSRPAAGPAPAPSVSRPAPSRGQPASPGGGGGRGDDKKK